MTTLRQAAQQALEALENLYRTLSPESVLATSLNHRITALRAALAEPEQEPVAWMEMVVSNLVREGVNKHKARQLAQHFTAPPQRKPLTDEEVEQAYRPIWRNLPDDFDYTSISWIEQGIRYAEQAHGIGEKK